MDVSEKKNYVSRGSLFGNREIADIAEDELYPLIENIGSGQ